MFSSGRIYAKNADKILELQFMGSEHKPMVAANLVGTVMEKATQMFTGVAIQSVLGTYYASVFPKPGSCVQKRLKELDGYKIINGKYEKDILMVVGSKNGRYDKFVYSLNNEAPPRIIKDVQGYNLNFTVLENGVCVYINENEEVEIFKSNNINKVKLIQDDNIDGNMRLCSNGNDVMFYADNKIYGLKMK